MYIKLRNMQSNIVYYLLENAYSVQLQSNMYPTRAERECISFLGLL